MTTFILKETVHRLLKDVKEIIKNPLMEQGIYYVHDESDMLKGYGMIVGPSETPYFGGFYFFEFTYPHDYPHNPPKVRYCTNKNNIRFNPNLYTSGKVCISLLNTWAGDQWTSCQSISTILLTLCTLFTSNPLLNEPWVNETHNDINNYNEIIEYSNIDIAVCDIVTKNSYIYKPFFDYFYSYVKENFYKNYDKLIDFVKKKKMDVKGTQIISAKIYQMQVSVNYDDIIFKLENSKKLLEIL